MKPHSNCAIYTRKSSEEGLEQEFNSLDAQREACEAYIVSQKHEGWKALPDRYDDGGFSGGNMERPALQKLMRDVQAGRIQTIVVYKVDRLTRALADFAKIVEQLDRHGVSFVSVTQQFNTTSSMGRLTLNVLLSFAQFEREVTGERIRDKIAASKAKGMWMGGVVPLGYAAQDRTLLPIPDEAKKVIHIYERYLALGNVRGLQVELKRDKVRSKSSLSVASRIDGDNFSRGALYTLLQNPIYIGRIRHFDRTHQGQHEAIVPYALWQAVQEKLATNRIKHSEHTNASSSLLSGFLFSPQGKRLTPSSTIKNGRRYRYYVLATAKLRLPAGELEGMVMSRLRTHLQEQMPERAEEMIAALSSNDNAARKSALTHSIDKIIIHDRRIVIQLKCGQTVAVDYCFSEQGPYRQMTTEGQAEGVSDIQKQAIIKSLLQGYIWRKRFFEDAGSTIAAIAKSVGKSETYVVRLITFSMLSPKLMAQILKGDIPPHITRQGLIYDLPISWAAQQKRFEATIAKLT